MRRTSLLLSSLLISLAFLAGCNSGSMVSSNQPPTQGGMAKVSLTMGDTPPAGVTVLSFEVTVTGAVLQPGNVSLVSTPIKVEVEHLQVETAFLSTVNVPAGTYNSITVTFANPELTISNNSGAAIGTCANGAVCELNPPLNPASVDYSGAPFPLTITANSPTGLLLDFNLNNSIQSDLSITPSISFTQLQATQGSGQLEELEDVVGQVTAKDMANNQFTFQQTSSGQVFTIKVDSNSEFEGFDEAGLQNNFASLAVSQVVEVDLKLMADGSFLAKKVELKESENETEGELEITIVSVDSATQFRGVVVDEARDIAGLNTGNVVTVTIQSGAQFGIETDDITVPSDLSFSSSADLLVGQNVEIRQGSGSSGTSIVTDRVRLRRSIFTATVMSISGSNFTVNNLPSLFTSANPPVTQIDVRTSSATEFEDVSGVGGLAVGDTVSLRGLLFKTTGNPALVADKVRKR